MVWDESFYTPKKLNKLRAKVLHYQIMSSKLDMFPTNLMFWPFANKTLKKLPQDLGIRWFSSSILRTPHLVTKFRPKQISNSGRRNFNILLVHQVIQVVTLLSPFERVTWTHHPQKGLQQQWFQPNPLRKSASQIGANFPKVRGENSKNVWVATT